MPGKRDVIIDSKVSLSGWEEYVNAKNEEEKRVALDKHIKLVRDKIKELSEKKVCYHGRNRSSVDNSLFWYHCDCCGKRY